MHSPMFHAGGKGLVARGFSQVLLDLEARSKGGGFGPIAQSEFAEDAADVVLRRLGGDD